MADEGRIPKLTVRGTSSSVLTTLPLDHLEGYVLSRVDGVTSEEELANGLGMPHDQVVDCLEKLQLLGLVTFQSVTVTRPSGTSSRVSREQTYRGTSGASEHEQTYRETGGAKAQA